MVTLLDSRERRRRSEPRPPAAARLDTRPLTTAETEAARSVFGDAIDYAAVRVCNRKYVFCQRRHWVMAPDGCIYWPGACADLVTGRNGCLAATFIHEMAHVYQHQRGLNVLWRGLVLHAARLLSLGLYDPYKVRYRPGAPFRAYNIEQQAQLAVMIWCGLVPNIIDRRRPRHLANPPGAR